MEESLENTHGMKDDTFCQTVFVEMEKCKVRMITCPMQVAKTSASVIIF